MITVSGRSPILLELDLTSPPADPQPDDPFDQLRNRGRRQLRPTLRALHEAATDRRVGGLVAKLGPPLPWALMQELRAGTRAFAAGGKPTVAWAETFEGEMSGYVLASAFGEIWLQPTGGLSLLGVGVEATFVRGALDKLGIEPQLDQRHEYKNAADQILRTEFSEAHRESLDTLVGSVFDQAVTDIADGRGMAADRVRQLIDTGPRTATEAREVGLVDRLGYRDQVYDAARSRLDGEAELLFADRWRPPRRFRPPVRRRHVALVEVRGTITSGRSRRPAGGRSAGSDSIGAELRAAADDDHAAAVVLRVASPGGSAVASDVIWRELSRVRESGKPVVVSMGEVAASGGYYIACPADVIVALPSTITGSIGVFGGKFVLRDLLERLGLTTGTVERGERSRMYSARRGFSAAERERLAAALDQIYDDFVAKVAQGRGRTVAEVESVARGRVWTGRDARRIGLVDELGGLREAVRIARSRAGLPDDAPVRPALHVPPLARLGRPRNSEDPRALLAGSWPEAGDLLARLGLPPGQELRLPDLRLR